MASFHGVWSFAGFTGALIGLGMLKFQLTPHEHFLIVGAHRNCNGTNYKF
jgi:hypothetical protein